MTPKHRRYYYHSMTPEQLSSAMDRLGLSMGQLARLSGVAHERIDNWLKGTDRVPHHIAVTLSLLTLPGAMEMAKSVTDALVYRKD